MTLEGIIAFLLKAVFFEALIFPWYKSGEFADLLYNTLFKMSSELNTPVVIDNGSGVCKAGLSG